MQIKTPSDWWKLCDDNWIYLLEILWHHLQPDHVAYEEPGNASSNMVVDAKGLPVPCCVEVERLRQTRDSKLARYFNAAWFLASDAYAWSVPGWGALCDLCSEEWAIHPEQAA